MRELDANTFGALEHRNRRCCPGDQSHDRPCGRASRRIRGVNQAVVYDRRTRHVGDSVFPDQLEDLCGIDLAQADIDAGRRRDSPWKAPAVAVKHWQRPEIDRMLAEIAGEDVADRIQVRTAVM